MATSKRITKAMKPARLDRLALLLIAALLLSATSTNGRGVKGEGRGDSEEEEECVDVRPPWSGNGCRTLAEFGECEEEWMQRYCLKSCDRCDGRKKSEDKDDERDSVEEVECPKNCNNSPPPFSAVSCETHKSLDKCKEVWMEGSCECTCGTCKALPRRSERGRERDDDDAEEIIVEVETDSGDADNKDKGEKEEKKAERNDPGKPSLKRGHTRFTILHFNDFHSRVEEADNYFGECSADESRAGRCHGGVARMKTVIDQERRNAARRGESVLLLNSGDDFAGTKWDYHYKGEPIEHFFNQLGIDAMTLGNHEFDYGPDVLANYLKSLNYSVVCANIKPNDHWIGSLVQPYVIKEIDGTKVGICGITTQVTMQWSSPWPVQFDDSTWKTRECVEVLQGQGVKIIILLSHEGLNADRYLGRQVPGIDLILGGHSHSFLYSGESPPAVAHMDGGDVRDVSWDSYPAIVDSWVEPGRKIHILQAGWASRYIGRFSVEFNEEGEIVDYEGWPILLGGASSDNPVRENLSWKEDVATWRWW